MNIEDDDDVNKDEEANEGEQKLPVNIQGTHAQLNKIENKTDKRKQNSK